VRFEVELLDPVREDLLMPRKDHVRMYLEYEARQLRAELFKVVAQRLQVQRALYAGSWIHVAPSLFVPEVVYVDSDRRCPAFFADEQIRSYIEQHRQYSEPASFRFHHADYTNPLGEQAASFDLLISQFAGFISPACRKYLRIGGHLLANDSHGDAGVAHLDPRYELIAGVHRQDDTFEISTHDLSSYFVPKRASDPREVEGLRALGRGLKYTNSADHYLFCRVA